MMLAISKGSFHYQYYRILRKIWAFDSIEDKSTNLCFYSQFLFWMTLFTIILSPFLLLGWLILKIGRLMYKILSLTSIGSWIIDCLDSIFGIGGMLEMASDRMIEKPVNTLLLISLLVPGIVIIIVGILILLIFGFDEILNFICKIPVFIMGFVFGIGLVYFYINCAIGWLIVHVLSNLFLFIAVLWKYFIMGAGTWISITVGVFIVGSIFTVLLVKLALSFDRVSRFIDFKINGFHKAKTENDKRRKEAQRIKREERFDREEKAAELRKKKRSGEIEYTALEKLAMITKTVLRKSFITIKNSLFSRTSKVKNGSVKVMGIFSLLWNLIKSVKDGVCPFVEFVEEEDLK